MWLMTAMGTILATISKWIHGDIPIQAEILAIKIYLEMTLHHGWKALGFFNDSRIIFRSITNRNSGSARYFGA